MSPVSKSLQHKTIASAAAEEIRRRIFNGEIEPGSQLRQEELAQQLGISRIPIREALLILENEALVKILPHRGAVVVRLSADEIEELFNMRMLLEPYLYERSAPHLTEADFAELESNCTAYAKSMRNRDEALWNSINTDFHLRLYAHARSPRVTSTVRKLLSECERHTRLQLSRIKEDRERAVREHAELLELARAGRYGDGAALMRRHIDHIREVIVGLLGEALRRGKDGPAPGARPTTHRQSA